jgi:cytochrome c oxidase subunit 4
MSNLWNKLFYHPARGWWNLPKTHYAEPNAPGTGPFGRMGMKVAQWWGKWTWAGKHTTPMFYIAVGVVLTVITLIEVWLFNVTTLGALYVPLLLALSAVKFAMVVGFYMHLRFDNRIFTFIFGFCLVLGVAMFTAVLMLQHFLS